MEISEEQLIELDSLHIYTRLNEETGKYEVNKRKKPKYPFGEFPTYFKCVKCGCTRTLEEMGYNPYSDEHYCLSCK